MLMREVVDMCRPMLLLTLLVGCSTGTGIAPDDAAPGEEPDADVADEIDAAVVEPGEPDASVPAPGALAARPPMGWNSWNKFGCDVNEELVKQMADALVSTGMKDVGYEYVVIDDCWQMSRNTDGTIVADASKFPGGIPALADYVHAKGLKLGLYTSAGAKTCQGRPGSRGYELLDAQTYAAWGVDYVKEDWCDAGGLDPRTQYTIMRDALVSTGRPIVFSVASRGEGNPSIWGPTTGHMWRTTGDLADNWGSMIGIVDANAQYAAVARPGSWTDPDMLEIGNGGMNVHEYRTHMSLWAMMAAPLMAGNDLRGMPLPTRNHLINPGVIAVDQDALGIPAVVVRDAGDLEVWSRPLAQPGARAVALVNRSGASAAMTVSWSEIGLAAGTASVLDLWTLLDNGPTPDAYTATVPAHGTVLLRVGGSEPPAPTGTVFVSDLIWTHAANGYGPAERDRSNGERGATDGRPLQLAGTIYGKGIGAHAGSLTRIHLGGQCTSFTAKIGVDDEVGDRGSVSFEVWSDADRLYESGVMTGAMPTQTISVDVSGRTDLRLVVGPGSDNLDYDHADWADAQLTCL